MIGEGEEAFPDVIRVYQIWKSSGAPRGALLERLSEIPGVYVPAFFEPEYNADGTLAAMIPANDRLPKRIRKRIVPILPLPPEHFVVPSIDVIQNRVAVEIMRGCSRGCLEMSFCRRTRCSPPVWSTC